MVSGPLRAGQISRSVKTDKKNPVVNKLTTGIFLVLEHLWMSFKPILAETERFELSRRLYTPYSLSRGIYFI